MLTGAGSANLQSLNTTAVPGAEDAELALWAAYAKGGWLRSAAWAVANNSSIQPRTGEDVMSVPMMFTTNRATTGLKINEMVVDLSSTSTETNHNSEIKIRLPLCHQFASSFLAGCLLACVLL